MSDSLKGTRQIAPMQPLSFPQKYEFDIRTADGKDVIFDVLRRKYVPLTPEE